MVSSIHRERHIPSLRKAVIPVSVTGGNVMGLKQMNKTAVIRLLLRKSPLTKAEVASRAELTFATVSNLITEMQSEGLVLEAGYAESNGGRKPVLYSVNPDAFSFIGIDLQVEKIVCVLTNFEGTLVHSDMMTYRVEEGPHNTVRVIQTLVQKVLEATHTLLDKVPAIGVSAPGPIDNATGVIISPPNMPDGVTCRYGICCPQSFTFPVIWRRMPTLQHLENRVLALAKGCGRPCVHYGGRWYRRRPHRSQRNLPRFSGWRW